MDELIAVGRIGPPRGVRGDVFVQPFTDDPDERFAPGSVLRTDHGEQGSVTVERLNLAGSRMVVKFEGMDTREAVEALRGARLLIAASERPPIDDPDEFYTSDLVGLSARTTGGEPLGAVEDVVEIAGADYLVLQIDGVQKLVPFVAAIVPTVSITDGYVEIDPPEGLFDL